MDLIDRESLLKKLEQFGLSNGCTIGMHSGITEILMEIVENEPTLGVVPKALYDQIKWERDIAISQLESFGVQLGEKANVKPVRHGKWVDAHKGLSADVKWSHSVQSTDVGNCYQEQDWDSGKSIKYLQGIRVD